MFEQSELITSEQRELLCQLEKFDTPLQFRSLTQIPMLSTDSPTKQSQTGHANGGRLIKAFSQIPSNVSGIKRHSSIQLSSTQLQSVELGKNLYTEEFMFLQRELQRTGGEKYNQMKKKLLTYKQKSEQIYKVSEFIKSYEENFRQLVHQKEELISMLDSIQGETSQLVDKQRKLIDLSMSTKESLDYYTYHSKSQLNYACEISSRQLFQDNLQSTLSTVMDAIEFFTENQTFVASKKHLNLYLTSKSKIISFVKSFFIKLFNKENTFILKHLNSNQIDTHLITLHPKSRMNLLTGFLLSFPHAKNCLKQILTSVKEQKVDNQLKQMELKFLEMREVQIDEVILSESNVSLIRYLEKNNFQIYSEVMLNLFSFNRTNFHENLLFNWTRRINSQTINKSQQPQKQRIKQYMSKLYFVVQLITAEYLYFHLCCRPSTPQATEFLTSWLYKLVLKYLEVLVKESRQLLIKHKINPFELCEIISTLVDQELKTYFEQLSKEHYQSYVMGCLWHETTSLNKQVAQQNPHSKFLRQFFRNSLKSRILLELSPFCYQNLPKIQSSTNKLQVEQNINKLMKFIPKLHYCSNQSQNYLISTLDLIIKSIKQVNLSIESRFECYAWNLVLFGVMRNVLKTRKLEVVSKQIRLDFNESLNIIDRVKRLQRSQSLIQYAQDIFNVIKTGMPSLNQLTLDFNKYINEHYVQLESRFLKDILFIYAKNMIQFLQRMMDSKNRISSENHLKSEKHLEDSSHLNHHHNHHHNQSQQNTTQTNLFEESNDKQSPKSQNSQEKSPKEKLEKSPKEKLEKSPKEKLEKSPKEKLEKSPKEKLEKSPKEKLEKSPRDKSPLTIERRNQKGSSQLLKICEPVTIKSLYNSYILSIQKYIKESRDILRMMEESKIENKETEVKNLKILIREVYEKLFDFLDTFYVTVSQFNSQITAEFEEIAKIKEKQESLWLGSTHSTSNEQISIPS